MTAFLAICAAYAIGAGALCVVIACCFWEDWRA